MFKSKTLFVIGAGASCEVGMPAGGQLKNDIAKLIDIKFKDGFTRSSGDQAVYEALLAYAESKGARDVNPLLHKCWAMAKSLPTTAESIDNYLFNHSDDAEIGIIGKLGIARAILMAEGASKLQGQKKDGYRAPFFEANALSDTWFMTVAQIMINHVRKSDVDTVFDNVDFITFNYDRTIERFFPQVLADHYGTSIDDVAGLLARRSIIHPYGHVGALGAQRGVGFGASLSGDSLLTAASGLRTFDEGVAESAMLDHMRALFAEAETIVFLGFAFHEQNMELLNPGRPCAARRIFMTYLGLSSTALGAVRRELIEMLGHPLGGPDPASGEIAWLAFNTKANKLMEESQRALRS